MNLDKIKIAKTGDTTIVGRAAPGVLPQDNKWNILHIVRDGNQIRCDVVGGTTDYLEPFDTTPAVQYTFSINPTPDTATVIINGQERKTITADEGTTIIWQVSADGYVTQSGQYILTEDEALDIILEQQPVQQVTFSINPTPTDAIVEINNVVQNSITVNPGTNVSWKVSKTGYITQQGSEVVNENKTIEVVLEQEVVQYTFTINPTPENALVKLNGVEQKSITVDSGTTVNWEVSASGYVSKSGSEVITENKTLDVVLEAVPVTQYTLTINPTPADAVVKIDGEVRSSITVDENTEVSYEVSKEGYITQSGTHIVDSDETLDIILQAIPEYTFTIVPTPADATVTINGTVQTSVSVEYGSTVTWQVSATGYVTQSGEQVVTSDTNLPVVLEEELPLWVQTDDYVADGVTYELQDAELANGEFGTVYAAGVNYPTVPSTTAAIVTTSDKTDGVVTLTFDQYLTFYELSICCSSQHSSSNAYYQVLKDGKVVVTRKSANMSSGSKMWYIPQDINEEGDQLQILLDCADDSFPIRLYGIYITASASRPKPKLYTGNMEADGVMVTSISIGNLTGTMSGIYANDGSFATASSGVCSWIDFAFDTPVNNFKISYRGVNVNATNRLTLLLNNGSSSFESHTPISYSTEVQDFTYTVQADSPVTSFRFQYCDQDGGNTSAGIYGITDISGYKTST